MLWGSPELRALHDKMVTLMKKHPKELGNNFEFRELSITEQQTEMWKKIRFIQENYHEMYLENPVSEYPYFGWFEHVQGKQLFTGLHYSLFTSIIYQMADQEQ